MALLSVNLGLLGTQIDLGIFPGSRHLAAIDGQLVLLDNNGAVAENLGADASIQILDLVDSNGVSRPVLDLGVDLNGGRLLAFDGQLHVLDGAGNVAATSLALNLGTAGNDVLSAAIGTVGALLGLGGNDQINGRDGNDVASGGNGDDAIDGAGGNDTLQGGAGNDTISGGDGNDVIMGGAGNDFLAGGAGSDTFVFGAGEGADIVQDFRAVEGDRFILTGQSYAFHQEANGTVIDLSGGGQITLMDVTNYDPSSSGGTLVAQNDTFRFFDTREGGHFYTTDVVERDYLMATRPDFRYEGTTYNSFEDASFPGAAPVYRFFNTKEGGHFYTTSEVERDSVIASLPDYKFEGTAFYEFTQSQGSNTEAVYRFFDTKNGGHFYTTSEVERDTIIGTLPNLSFEGVAFYAPQEEVGFVV
jgi:Ca2+-binding RTX toxin-like protein